MRIVVCLDRRQGTNGDNAIVMFITSARKSFAVACVAVTSMALPLDTPGQIRPKVRGTVQVGAVVTASFTGSATGYRWEACTRIAGLTCTKFKRLGRAKSLTIPRSAAGLQIRVRVKFRNRWIASAWSETVKWAPTSGATPGKARTNPVPLGQNARLYDSWKMEVVSFTPDATASVLAENMFNDAPADGSQFAIVRVRATFTGTGSDSFDASFRLRAVGSNNVELSTFENSCGVIPDEISSATVFSGGTIEGNICFQVRTSEVWSLVLYDDGSFRDSDRRWFAVQ